MKNFKGLKIGDKVLYKENNKYYKVESFDDDVVYLTDNEDGSSFIATDEEIVYIR